MKKFIMSLAVFGSTLSARLVKLRQPKTVEYSGSWAYGSTGKRAYSNLSSSKRWHSSSVTIDEGSNMSGDTQPGITSKAERIAGYTATSLLLLQHLELLNPKRKKATYEKNIKNKCYHNHLILFTVNSYEF